MKEFKQFLSSVDMDKIMSISNLNEEQLKNSSLMVTSISAKFTIEILRQYHEWLMKELD